MPEPLLPRYNFYLLSGLPEQGRALVDFAAVEGGTQRRLAMLVSPDADNAAIRQAVKRQAQKQGFTLTESFTYPEQARSGEAFVGRLQGAGVEVLVHLGTREQLAGLLGQLEQSDWQPRILAPAALSGALLERQGAGVVKRKLHIAYPALGVDFSATGRRALGDFLERHQLPRDQIGLRISAYASMEVLTEALKRTGRDLNRNGLVSALEAFYDFQTGVLPGLTYSGNRHVGALGAHVVSVAADGSGGGFKRRWVTPR